MSERGRDSRLARLRGRHEGERVVLVANGPSLNRMDLRFLQRETTIGLNKIYLGLRRFRFIHGISSQSTARCWSRHIAKSPRCRA